MTQAVRNLVADLDDAGWADVERFVSIVGSIPEELRSQGLCSATAAFQFFDAGDRAVDMQLEGCNFAVRSLGAAIPDQETEPARGLTEAQQ